MSHVEEVVDELDLVRDRKSAFGKVAQKSALKRMSLMPNAGRKLGRTIADNERRVRRSWTSSDLRTSESQTVGPCPFR